MKCTITKKKNGKTVKYRIIKETYGGLYWYAIYQRRFLHWKHIITHNELTGALDFVLLEK